MFKDKWSKKKKVTISSVVMLRSFIGNVTQTGCRITLCSEKAVSWMIQCSNLSKGKLSSKHTNQHWGPLSLLFSVYWHSFYGGKVARM
jgi:hypothetical protein